MCIIFVYANANPPPGGYKFIVASNRDEFYARPAACLAAWPPSPGAPESDFVLGGRDMEPGREGGTWLAVGNCGGRLRLAALLNITGEPHAADALGRGFLCGAYVAGDQPSDEYCKRLVQNRHVVYNAFNLLTVELGYRSATIRMCSNAPPSYEEWCTDSVVNIGHSTKTTAAFGFGNSPPCTPLAKVCAGREKFDAIRRAATEAGRDRLCDQLMELLADRNKCWPDEELKRRAPYWGNDLSSICVRVPGAGYGTRTHSVILVDADNRLDYYERTMATCDPDGDWESTHITRQVELHE